MKPRSQTQVQSTHLPLPEHSLGQVLTEQSVPV
jgi:hypothetical protein